MALIRVGWLVDQVFVEHIPDSDLLYNDKDIVGLNIPTGLPLVYELNDNLKPIKNYYLGDPEEVKKAMEAVASQGKAKK